MVFQQQVYIAIKGNVTRVPLTSQLQPTTYRIDMCAQTFLETCEDPQITGRRKRSKLTFGEFCLRIEHGACNRAIKAFPSHLFFFFSVVSTVSRSRGCCCCWIIVLLSGGMQILAEHTEKHKSRCLLRSWRGFATALRDLRHTQDFLCRKDGRLLQSYAWPWRKKKQHKRNYN